MNDPRSRDDADADRRRQVLSGLVDGHCEPQHADEALKGWRSDERWRRDWHAYQLIGDVLRSDELAPSGQRDEAFLSALRVRLAEEPVPLAPRSVAPPRPEPRRWMSAAAMVAGVGVVGVTVLAMRPGSPGGSAGWSQAQTAVIEPGGALQRVGSPAMPASQVLRIDGQLIRDVRLDAYFEAHRGAVDNLSTLAPGSTLRNVELLAPPR